MLFICNFFGIFKCGGKNDYDKSFFVVEELVSNHISLKLSEVNGNLKGFSTQDEFITAIQESNARLIGCFQGGAGKQFFVIIWDLYFVNCNVNMEFPKR